MANIRQRDEIDKESAYELWWQAHSRITGAGAVLTAMRETFEEEGLELTLDANQKTAHEALANLGEWAAFDSLELLHGLFKAAELWETRAKECGWKAEDAPAASPAREHVDEHAEDESNRDREQKALVELALLDSTPTEAIKAARHKLHMLCLKANDEK